MENVKESTKEKEIKIKKGYKNIEMVELGEGDDKKNSKMRKEMMKKKVEKKNMAKDIKERKMKKEEKNNTDQIKGLKVEGLNGEYFDMLQKANEISSRKKVVLMLGGNIGNDEPETALEFCRKICGSLQQGDVVRVGFDLKRNLATILAAYKDSSGFRRTFNLNLFARINN